MDMCAFFLTACLSSSPTPPPPPSRTSTRLWGLGGGDSFQQRLAVLTPLCALDQSISLKSPWVTGGLPVVVSSLWCHVWAKLQSPFSSVLISAPELLCLHLSCYSRLMSQGSHGSGAPFPLAKQDFLSLNKSRENSSPGCCSAMAPGRAPVHMSWSVVQLIHYFLVCKRKKLLLSARHTSLSWVTHSLFYSQDCSPQSLHALLHLLPRWC